MKKRRLFTIILTMTFLSGTEIALIILSAFYCIVILGLATGLSFLGYERSTWQPFVSVIVAARDEESNLPLLLRHLLNQDYPAYEVIVANDRSTDRSGQILRKFEASDPRLRHIEISSVRTDMPPKKNALQEAIGASKGEILLFTDADCFPPPAWISTMTAAFSENVGLVAGYSPYTADINGSLRSERWSLLRSFIEYEEMKGATWSAAAIGLGRPWLCTGRSLAYRRSVFDEVGGFEKIRHSVSGDDDLFLQLVRRTTPWGIRYVTDPRSFVPTIPPQSFKAFVQQRTRHFSAGQFFPPAMKLFFFTFHTSNLLLLLSAVTGLLLTSQPHAFFPFIAKCVADTLLFFRSAIVFRSWKHTPTFLFHEFLYVLYNSFIGPLGFVSRFEWKPEKR